MRLAIRSKLFAQLFADDDAVTTILGHMRIAHLINGVRVLAVLAAFACCGCIDISSTSQPSSNTTCTTTDNGSGVPPTTTCTSKPTGGSHWSFFL